MPFSVSAWGDTDEAERALRVTYQERIRELRGCVGWLNTRIAQCRRERDWVLVASYSEERRFTWGQIRQRERILALIDARREDEKNDPGDDWW